jgi:hypothetical protein
MKFENAQLSSLNLDRSPMRIAAYNVEKPVQPG